MSNGDTPAFPGEGSPYFESNDGKQRLRSEYDMPQEPNSGLTKREFFAAMAMQGLLAYPENMSFHEVATAAVIHADMLLEELAKDS